VTVDLEVEQAASRQRLRDIGNAVRGVRVGSHEIRAARSWQLGHDIVGEPCTHGARDETGRAAQHCEAPEPSVHRAGQQKPPIDRP
jgi:hypothetical protein